MRLGVGPRARGGQVRSTRILPFLLEGCCDPRRQEALVAKLKPLADPYYTAIIPAPGGWSCDGKRVAAFALTTEGRTVAMVANGPDGGEDALAPGMGRLVG